MMIKKLLSEIWPWWQWSSPGGDSGPDRFWRSLQASRGPEAGSACWLVWIFILTPFSALGTLADSSAGLPRSRRWWRRWRTFIPIIRVVVFLLKIENEIKINSIPFPVFLKDLVPHNRVIPHSAREEIFSPLSTIGCVHFWLPLPPLVRSKD